MTVGLGVTKEINYYEVVQMPGGFPLTHSNFHC